MSDHTADDLRAVLEAQRTLSHCMLGAASREWAELDLTLGQLKTLMLLAAREGQTISEVAAHLGIGKPGASVVVDRLVQQGLVHRAEDTSDRRRTLVRLTATADQLIARLREGKHDLLAQWLAALAPDDLAALRRGMRALAAVASAQHGAPTPPPTTDDEHTVPMGATHGNNPRSE